MFINKKKIFFLFTVSSSSGMARTPPIVGSAFPRGSRIVLLYEVSLLMGSWERRRRIGMAVNHTPILLYGEDQSLQSIKKNWFLRELVSLLLKFILTYIYVKLRLNKPLFNVNNKINNN